jgi:hypothetical protein
MAVDTTALSAAAAAAVLTAAWAAALAASPNPVEAVRIALSVAGTAATLSFLVVDVDPRAVNVAAAVVLPLYQALAAVAFSRSAVAAQAIINCNVLLVLLAAAARRGAAPPADVVAAAAAMVAAAAYIAHREPANAQYL